MLVSALVQNSLQMKAPMIFSAPRDDLNVRPRIDAPPCQHPPAAVCPRPRSLLLAPPSTAVGPPVKVLRPPRPLLRAPACRADSSTRAACVVTARRGPCSAPLTEFTLRGFPAVCGGPSPWQGPSSSPLPAPVPGHSGASEGGSTPRPWTDGRTGGSCWPPEPPAAADGECPWAVKLVLSSQLSIFPEL